MDLGATTCTVRQPACGQCPWHARCEGRRRDLVGILPRKTPSAPRPRRYAFAFWFERDDGAVLLRVRPDDGLLGGMHDLPATPWRTAPWSLAGARRHAPVQGAWLPLAGSVRHGFTHFEAEITTAVLLGRSPPCDGAWHRPDEFTALALSTMTRKLVRHVLASRPDGTNGGDAP